MGEIFARRYELLDPIADGGMGSVWRVLDHQDGQVKAAKLLRHSDASSLLRFMREQSTRIHHPHVVTPLSWIGEDDYMLFTMPLVRGGSVATLVGDWGPLPEPWVRAVLEQTLSALAAVHAAGVVHRDVKPANLLLDPTGQAPPHVKLTDFGIAAPLGQPRLTSASYAVGTPGYMAPEQRLGAAPDPRQDLYSAAMVGMEMLLGHPPPFAADERAPGPLAAVLTRALAADPQQRPPTAEAMRAELLAAVSDLWEPGEVEVLDHFADADADADIDRSARAAPTAVLSAGEPAALPVGAQPPTAVLPHAAPPSRPAGAVRAPVWPGSAARPGPADPGARSPSAGRRPSQAMLMLLVLSGAVLLVVSVWLLLA